MVTGDQPRGERYQSNSSDSNDAGSIGHAPHSTLFHSEVHAAYGTKTSDTTAQVISLIEHQLRTIFGHLQNAESLVEQLALNDAQLEYRAAIQAARMIDHEKSLKNDLESGKYSKRKTWMLGLVERWCKKMLTCTYFNVRLVFPRLILL